MGPAQIGQGFPDGNQIAAFTLHALFSHAPQTRQGHHSYHSQRKRQRNQNRNRMPDSIWSASIGPPRLERKR